MTDYARTYQIKARGDLASYFARVYNESSISHVLRLPYEVALARYTRFEQAAYDTLDDKRKIHAAVEVVEDTTCDLACNHRALVEQISKLLRADNPSRACKLYCVAVADCATVDGDRVMKRLVLGSAALGCLTAVGLLTGFVYFLVWLFTGGAA